MSIKVRIFAVIFLLAVLAIGQASLRLYDAQTSLAKGHRVLDALPQKALLKEMEQLLEEEQLQIYARLASSKRLRGKAVDPFQQEINDRLDRLTGVQNRLPAGSLSEEATTALAELADLRPRALEEMQKSSMVRDVTMARTWLSGSQRAVLALNENANGLIPATAMLDTEMRALVTRIDQLDQAQLELSEYTAAFGGFVASRGHLSIAVASQSATRFARLEKAVEAGFADLDALETPDGPITSAAILTAPLFQIANALIDVSVNGGDRPKGANAPTWFEETGAVRMRLQQATDALDTRLVAHIETLIDAAALKRNVAILTGVVCALFVVASSVIIAVAVLRPLNTAISHIGALVEGDHSIDVNSLPAKHEFGRLRSALEALVTLSRQNQKLQDQRAEQEAKMRAAEREAAEQEAKLQQAERERIEQEAKAREADRKAEREEARLQAERLQEEKRQAEAEQQALQSAQEAERRAAAEIAAVVAACADGDFSQQLRTDDKDGVFAELCVGLNQICKTTNEGLGAVRTALEHLAQGDLTYRMPDGLRGAFAEIAAATNGSADSLNHTMTQISASSLSVDGSSREIAGVATNLTTRSEQNAAMLEKTATAIQQMAASVASSSETAKTAKSEVDHITTKAGIGHDVVRQAVSAMAAIKSSSDAIEKILQVIDEMSFQTNLLALNAGVEAARAGEAGRGFAVVASEVRALAGRSSEAAQEIANLIRASKDNIGKGVSLVNESGEALQQIVEGVERVAQRIGEISVSSAETAGGFGDISNATSELDRSTQSNVAFLEETMAAVTALQSEASSLSASVAAFKLTQSETDPGREAA